MPEVAEILEKVDQLPTYDEFTGEKPKDEEIWKGDEGGIRFEGTKRKTTSHGGTREFFLGVEGGSADERAQFIAKFVAAFGEPFMRNTDPRWPNWERLGFYNVEEIIEQNKREK